MTDDGSWVCAGCGEPHERRDPPCRACAGERFVRPGERDTAGRADEEPTVEGGATVVYECSACGRRHRRNSPPCNDCGTMTLEPVRGPTDDPAEAPGRLLDVDRSRLLVVARVGSSLWAAALVLLALALLPTAPGASPVLAAAGLFAAPAVRRRFTRALGADLHPLAALAVEIALVGLALVALLD